MGNSNNTLTGTQGVQQGDPGCPQPDINGIRPLNWSCPTGPQSYALPTATVTRPAGPPGSYLVPSVGPPGSYIQPDVGGPGSYIVPPEGPPGSYLNSTAGGTQVRTGPGGAIILSPGANKNAQEKSRQAEPNQNESRQTQSLQAEPRQDIGAMQGGVVSNGGASPYRVDTGAMQPTISGTGFTFGPQNASAQAVQGLVGLIGNSAANAAATKTASAKRSGAAAANAQAAATNAQAAQAINGFIRMLGTEP